MTPELTEELLAALRAHKGDLKIVDPKTKQIYFVVDGDKHDRAERAIQQQADLESVQRGLQQARNGDSISLTESEGLLRKRLDFPTAA